MQSWQIVGDSHIRAIQYAADNGKLTWPASFMLVSGATAVGLRNPNSQTDALGRFSASLLPIKRDVVPVIQLGEVDCGFVIWYRAQKYGESVDDQLRQSLDAYFDFVELLLSAGYSDIVVTAPVLPTIRDGQDWGDVANARRDVTATLVERTMLTIRYSEGLKCGALERGVHFLDITEEILDIRTGVVKETVRNPNPLDHHLDYDLSGDLWASRLNLLAQRLS